MVKKAEAIETPEAPAVLFINPAVPPELKALAESATAALKTHTAEGKAIVLMELRKRYDVAIAEMRAKGYDTARPDEKIIMAMAKTFGRELTDVIVGEWRKAVANEKLDGLPEGIVDAGREKAVINMALAVGQEAAWIVFTEMFNRAVWEGAMLMYAGFQKFKDDILTENES